MNVKDVKKVTYPPHGTSMEQFICVALNIISCRPVRKWNGNKSIPVPTSKDMEVNLKQP